MWLYSLIFVVFMSQESRKLVSSDILNLLGQGLWTTFTPRKGENPYLKNYFLSTTFLGE
jgi:hypothetical protein